MEHKLTKLPVGVKCNLNFFGCDEKIVVQYTTVVTETNSISTSQAEL
jgi:hypothetical protein